MVLHPPPRRPPPTTSDLGTPLDIGLKWIKILRFFIVALTHFCPTTTTRKITSINLPTRIASTINSQEVKTRPIISVTELTTSLRKPQLKKINNLTHKMHVNQSKKIKTIENVTKSGWKSTIKKNRLERISRWCLLCLKEIYALFLYLYDWFWTGSLTLQLTLDHLFFIWSKHCLPVDSKYCHAHEILFKNGPSKISGSQSLKNLKWTISLKQTISLQFFKGCLPQILLGPFLNTFYHMIITPSYHGGRKWCIV